MSEPIPRPWTVEEFFRWEAAQPDRHELVDGFPLKMMAGAKNVHDDIVVNLIAELRQRLRGGGCRPFTGDGAVETRPGQIRRPDVGVDCGQREPNATQATLPKLVVEVLSPSTRDFDSFRKVDEYKAVSSMDFIALVEPNEALVWLWSKDGHGAWREERVRGLDKAVALASLGVTLPMSAIYEGIKFPTAPRLVEI